MLTTNEDKGLFLKAIKFKLCDEEGRKFVELDERGEWKEAPDQRIREKIRTALCDSKLKNALKIGPKVKWTGPDTLESLPCNEDEELRDFPLDDLDNVDSCSVEQWEDLIEVPDADVPASLFLEIASSGD